MSARRHPGGFSLIEVMCAILILGVALVGLTHGITTALSSTKDSEIETKIVLLAAGQMETLRAEGMLTDGATEGDFGDDVPEYAWEQTITPEAIDGLHKVEVVVKNATSGAALYTLDTLLFDTDYPADQDDKAAKRDAARDRKKKRRRE